MTLVPLGVSPFSQLLLKPAILIEKHPKVMGCAIAETEDFVCLQPGDTKFSTSRTTASFQFLPLLSSRLTPRPTAEVSHHAISAARQLHDASCRPIAPAA